ncbi:MAG: rhodanese-like domain-containing protein [Terriglobia bacterium]
MAIHQQVLHQRGEQVVGFSRVVLMCLRRLKTGWLITAAVLALLLAPGLLAALGTSSATHNLSAVPWSASQVITPETLAKELTLPRGQRPAIVCVGFKFLYQQGHIPDALYKGPAREASGLEQLLAWAHSIPAGTPVVIYCGCCPFHECPNVRPAFEALRTVGLTHVQVLDIEHSFVKDWTQKGYPTK